MGKVEDIYGPPCHTADNVPVEVFGVTLNFERRAANQLLRAAMRAYDVPYSVYRIESYNCRKKTSGTSYSAHAWPVAVDVNPDKNPYSTGGLITDMPPEFVNAWKAEGFGWGGDWQSVKDAMHFSLDPVEGGVPRPEEFSQKLQERARKKWRRVNKGILAPPADPPPSKPGTKAPPYPGASMSMARWKREGKQPDKNVAKFQRRLAKRGWTITASGDFDKRTDEVVRAFQREKRLAVDGVVGAATWKAIWEAPVT